MSEVRTHSATFSEEHAGMRLDQALARLFPDYSRSNLKAWIDAGQVRLNAGPCRPRDAVRSGDQVEFTAVLDSSDSLAPEPIAFELAYEDEAVLVVDKPAGLVVHPGAGNTHATLANGLIFRFPELSQLPRAGLIHRLDKDTSGLLIVARTQGAYQQLVRDMAARKIKRVYDALANGHFIAGGTIDQPIGRDPSNRTRMTVRAGGREAVTHYRITRKYRAQQRLEITLETGRTHQIRVHCADAGHPLVGDARYGARVVLPRAPSAALDQCLRAFNRPALHARRLEFRHPDGERNLRLQSATPPDLSALFDACEQDCVAIAHDRP